ncbi:PLP-dependent aminotransferase family protein [Paenibacillus hunanensis]|uniref:MocR-like pyridoxine biosynthesis transcription factor PdxR n=1 Tax=Paenibacillus hunanensis TaxID=539262 RepID=UPI002026459E|nr:PLP-dependent aminotransferase family protein [Paenibacillus hunanensis]MCL9659626.1 PLP-dependent aminotransferase family protein [Paenibacillus hunanensis]
MNRSKRSWLLERDGTIPLYRQIEQQLRQRISNGEWPVGTRLPSQRKLAEQLGVNRSTITQALDELASWGMVEGNKGGGTRVVNNTWNRLAAATIDWDSYVESGAHQPNLPAIRQINEAEYDPSIIRTGTGEPGPDLLPTERVRRILADTSDEPFLGYEEPKGSLRLREQIVQYAAQQGISCSPESILIVSGALQALQLIAVGLLQRPSCIVAETPSYIQSVRVFQSAGIGVHAVQMDEHGIQINHLQQQIAEHHPGLLYTIPTFHNPTGTILSSERRAELLELSSSLSLPLIEDDVYRELWLDEEPPPPLKSQDRQGNILYLGSLSKMMSPGIRVGWIIAPVPVIDRLADIKMQTDYGSSGLSQYVAARWLADGHQEQHQIWVRQQLRTRRARLLAALDQYFGDIAQWNVPAGGFYIWLRLPTNVNVHRLFTLALREQILIHPGYMYDRQASHHIRLSYSYADMKQLEQSIYRLRQLVKQCMNT